MLIETHAHLDYPDFDDVLRRVNDAGVTRIITVGTSIKSRCGDPILTSIMIEW